MQDPMDNDTPASGMSAEFLYEQIESFVSHSRRQLAAGVITDLTGMDRKVSHVCSAVLALPREEAVRFADRLEGLLEQVRALGEELEAARDATQAEIEGVHHQHKAHKAYKASDAMDGRMISRDRPRTGHADEE